MKAFYIICFLLSFSLFLWQSVSDARQSVVQHTALLIVIISNGGYLALAGASNLTEAVLATKILYVAACFLPMLYFITVCEVCRVHINRFLLALMCSLQIALYGMVCTIGHNDLFYRNTVFHIDEQVVYLTKDYGPFHLLYLVTMYGYYLLTLVVATHTVRRKKSVDHKGIAIMMLSFLLAIAGYILERALHWKAEIMPLLYVLLMAVSYLQTYQSNLFTIEENKDIIHEQLEKVGFIAFGLHGQYMGCNPYAESIFPSMKNYRIGRMIQNPDLTFHDFILKPVMQFSQTHYHGVSSGGHEHEKITTFVQGEKTYDGMIHTLQNYYGKRSGFVVELRDETEHYRALELFEHYNQKLAEEVDTKTQQIASIQEKIILGMAQIIESRDLSTGGHIKRTSTVVRIFADELLKADMGFDPAFLHLVVRSAPMHDLGKIGVDDAVLRKQGKFTPEEYAKMKEHPTIGARIVKEVLTDVEAPDFVTVAANVAHYHHEKVDGTGYPCGLKGTEIPVEARIMALADVFDALVSKRCYKEAFSFDKSFSIIAQDAGTHFDSELAGVFLQCRPQLEHFYQEQENDHEQI